MVTPPYQAMKHDESSSMSDSREDDGWAKRPAGSS
jgi:hypothetical protein